MLYNEIIAYQYYASGTGIPLRLFLAAAVLSTRGKMRELQGSWKVHTAVAKKLL